MEPEESDAIWEAFVKEHHLTMSEEFALFYYLETTGQDPEQQTPEQLDQAWREYCRRLRST